MFVRDIDAVQAIDAVPDALLPCQYEGAWVAQA
jgi:hypothetical protein